MRTRLTLDVGPYARFVIARYYGRSGRATRAEVRRFASAALETQAREWATGLPRRSRAIADRLRDGGDSRPETIRHADGLWQGQLF